MIQVGCFLPGAAESQIRRDADDRACASSATPRLKMSCCPNQRTVSQHLCTTSPARGRRAPPAAAARLPTPVVRRWRRRRERDALKSPSTGVRAVKHRSEGSEAAGARVQSTEKGEGGWWFSKMTFEMTDASLSSNPFKEKCLEKYGVGGGKRGGRARSEPRPDRRSHANNGKKTENANQSTLDIPNEISLLVTAASKR